MARHTEISMYNSVNAWSRRPSDDHSHTEGRVDPDVDGLDPRVSDQNPQVPNPEPRVSGQEQTQIVNVVRDLIRRDLGSLAADDYVINGTVQFDNLNHERGMILVEDTARAGGDRFVYRPARIKLDTGSRADFVTREYLARIGFNIDSLAAIPEAQQQGVEGLDKVIYRPTHQANLQWYRQGEAQMNITPFLVIDHGPFDLLLSSRRFAEEAERRLFSLPLVRPRKTPGRCPRSV